jgi:hypothetical protein
MFALILSVTIFAQWPEKANIEKEPFTKAHQNIEKYRKDNLTILSRTAIR